MRQRKDIPADQSGRQAWLALAELQGQLKASSRVEFAAYLLLGALEDEDLAAESDAEELAAVSYAYEVLDSAGW